MKKAKSLGASFVVELTSASVNEMLTSINCAGIQLNHVHYINELTVICCISVLEYKVLTDLLIRRGESIRIVQRRGLFWICRQLLNRPVLIVTIICLVLLSIILPTRVLFVSVDGNTIISSAHILDEAERCGISFGASRREVRSEKMKNALLESIPELQWAGINTDGCTAVITVKERSRTETGNTLNGINSVVAAKDGVIQELTVLRGNVLCKAGDAVKKGQVLISGYNDCGISVKATGAKGEVYALTRYDVDVLAPQITELRGKITTIKSKYYLQIGKKLINLSQDSGILDSTCVKMYTSSFLTLPGGFQLPIGLVREQHIFTDLEQPASLAGKSGDWVWDYIEEYLRSQMIAGQILQVNCSANYTPGIFILSGNISCVEMIGRIQTEEIIRYNGQNG